MCLSEDSSELLAEQPILWGFFCLRTSQDWKCKNKELQVPVNTQKDTTCYSHQVRQHLRKTWIGKVMFQIETLLLTDCRGCEESWNMGEAGQGVAGNWWTKASGGGGFIDRQMEHRPEIKAEALAQD